MSTLLQVPCNSLRIMFPCNCFIFPWILLAYCFSKREVDLLKKGKKVERLRRTNQQLQNSQRDVKIQHREYR